MATERAAAGRGRGTVLLTVGYVVPLALATVGLFLVGDAAIAIALLVVEVTVVGSIRLVARRSSTPRPGRPVRAPGEPVLGLPGDPHATGGMSGAVAALALVGVVALLGVAVALISALG